MVNFSPSNEQINMLPGRARAHALDSPTLAPTLLQWVWWLPLAAVATDGYRLLGGKAGNAGATFVMFRNLLKLLMFAEAPNDLPEWLELPNVTLRNLLRQILPSLGSQTPKYSPVDQIGASRRPQIGFQI